MWLNELYQRLLQWPRTGRRNRPKAERRRGLRLALEQLEDRSLPSSFTVATVAIPSLDHDEPQHHHKGTSYPGGVIALAGIGNDFHDHGKGGKGTSGCGCVL